MDDCRMISKTGTPLPLANAGYKPVRASKRTFVAGSGPVHHGPCACSCCSAYYEGRLSTGRRWEYQEVWVSEEPVEDSWSLVTDQLGIIALNDIFPPEMAGKIEYV
jgi:hypothetical protein